MSNPYHEQEQAYDHLDDTGLFDAATVRELSGYETDGENADFTAEAIAARAGNIALTGAEVIDDREEWVQSMHLTKPSSSGPYVRATPEEMASTSAAVAEQKTLIVPMRDGKE